MAPFRIQLFFILNLQSNIALRLHKALPSSGHFIYAHAISFIVGVHLDNIFFLIVIIILNYCVPLLLGSFIICAFLSFLSLTLSPLKLQYKEEEEPFRRRPEDHEFPEYVSHLARKPVGPSSVAI